eukprot:COSAG01_NODE_30597_length_613_cov_0.877432_1_plen_51_part_10
MVRLLRRLAPAAWVQVADQRSFDNIVASAMAAPLPGGLFFDLGAADTDTAS